MSVPGVDHPEVDAEAEVALASHGTSVSSRVEYTGDALVVVRPSAGEFVEQTVVAPGDAVTVYWKGPTEQRSVPAEVVEVEGGAAPRWHLRVTGPAEESQRRTAVRARVALAVTVTVSGTELPGKTVDLSEAGMRIAVDGVGLPPEPGTRLQLVVPLDGGDLRTSAEVVRNQVRGVRWVMSTRFLQLPQKDEDRLRRRVFQALREERARGSE